MISEAAAREAIALFNEVEHIDSLLRNVIGKRDTAPIQKVTFYRWTSTYSGPHDYQPVHVQEAIAACIVLDLKTERLIRVDKIKALGFDAPAFEEAKS